MPRHKNVYEYHGKMMTAYELAEISDFSVDVIRQRIRAGWKVEDAVEQKRNFRMAQRTQKKIKCGAESWKDCFVCRYDDCIMTGRVKFEDETDILNVLFAKREKDLLNA